VWAVTTVIVCFVLGVVLYAFLTGKPFPVITWMPILLGIWGGTAVLFIGGNVLIDALAKSVEKAELKLQATVNATANTSISGSATGNATADSGKK
jgi:hypothetical protein